MTAAPAAVVGADRNQSGRPLLQLENLSCSFGSVLALDRASLEVRHGEVHALLGENGSGKSTLAKILAGYHSPDSGQLTLRGEDVPLPLEPGAFRRLGISFVHQNLGLVRSLSALENLRVGLIAERSGFARIKWHEERRYAKHLFADFGVDIDPDTTVDELSDLNRARLAIVRAAEELTASMSGANLEGGLLVLDEPTVFLPQEAVGQLFDLIREVVSRGVSVLFVSHDLDEVMTIADRMTILRDGRVMGTFESATSTKDKLVSTIIGRDLAELHALREPAVQEVVGAEVSLVSGLGVVEASFSVRNGEVVGLTGLIGSGFDDLPYLLFGVHPDKANGSLTVDGTRFNLHEATIEDLLASGVVLVPGDREELGCTRSLSVEENITLPVLSDYFEAGRLDLNKMATDVEDHMSRLEVRPPHAEIPVGFLSGGNQQKVVMAKYLQMQPRFLLMHEPTQGVDVGAREQIFGLINEEAQRGTAVVCASTDAEQLAAICDRVLVFNRGKIAAELSGELVEKESISRLIYRGGEGTVSNGKETNGQPG